MMVDKEDLGLSLSLSCTTGSAASSAVVHGGLPRNHHLLQHPSPLQLNLLGAASSSTSSSLPAANLPFASSANLKASWLESFPSSDRTSEAPCRVVGSAGSGAGANDPRSFLRGIDVNRTPANAAEDDEAGVSSPNSTISSVSGKRSEREVTAGGAAASAGDDLDLSRGISDEEDGDTSRKKLRLSKDQSNVLEESFKEHNTLNPKQKLALAKRLGLRPRQVEVWFQNRRARTKLKQTEVDCEFLKRCCEQLTEENRRLQKEVQELRTLKLSPQFYMQMTPPTTLTMCPSCERVSAPPSAAPASVDSRPGQGGPNRGLLMNPWGVAAPVPVRPFGK